MDRLPRSLACLCCAAIACAAGWPGLSRAEAVPSARAVALLKAGKPLWSYLGATLEFHPDAQGVRLGAQWKKLAGTFIGLKVDFFQRDDQPMVEFYWKLSAEAARRHLTLDFHGAHKPAGLQRAYPNVLNIEGVKGMEQGKWSRFITPTHDVTLPYTRMVAGPMDYTPGAMKNSQPADFRPDNSAPGSMGTRCHELAKYVIYDAPLQMLSDAPPHYRKEPKTMDFLKEVPTVWDESIAVDGRIGEFAVMARRSGDRWFLGGLTNESAREVTLPDLQRLGPGPWPATVWQDTPESATKATAFTVANLLLKPEAGTTIRLAPSGGFVAILTTPPAP